MIQANLFISNFNRIGKRVAMAAAVAVCICGVCHGLNYLYVDSGNGWERVMWHNYYAQDQNIDNLFLGSSHVHNDVNPFLLDDLNGENNFNFSMGNQSLNGSYYLLKEVDKEHDLKHVYVELYYDLSTGTRGEYKAFDNLNFSCWQNTDYMKWSCNKLRYMLNECRTENYIETFLPFVRYRSKLFDIEYIKSQVAKKQDPQYKEFQYIYEDERGITQYQNKGYWYRTWELFPERLSWETINVLDEYPMTKDAEKYLREIIEYCEEEDIALTLFSSPIYELQVISVENYDGYVNQVRAIAAEYDIPYYDFNLCKEAYLPIQQVQYFADMGHLNANGASLFTNFLYQITQQTSEENDKYFYHSYAEKLEQTEGTIYGIMRVYLPEQDEDEIGWKIASNRSEGMEYRILITPQDEEPVMFQDFCENPYFTVPKEENGRCIIVARRTGQQATQTLEIEY